MADSETQSYVRLRRLIGEASGATIQGYDEARWARIPSWVTANFLLNIPCRSS